jgi:hypothetical protein
MSIVIYRPAAARGDGLLRALARALSRFRQHLAEAAERRRLRRASIALATVNERTLRDIGLERCRLQHGLQAADRRQADRFLKFY